MHSIEIRAPLLLRGGGIHGNVRFTGAIRSTASGWSSTREVDASEHRGLGGRAAASLRNKKRLRSIEAHTRFLFRAERGLEVELPLLSSALLRKRTTFGFGDGARGEIKE